MPDVSVREVDTAVVGGGAIGLSVAWRVRKLGRSVIVVERDRFGGGASSAAAGMLAPTAEAEFGETAQELLELSLRSAAMWPRFAAELSGDADVELALQRSGTLLVARDADEARGLERQIALRDSLGLTTRRLRASEARALEPALAPTIRLALEVPDDHSVDPRLLLLALRLACVQIGVELVEHAGPAAIALDGESVSGLRLADGSSVRAETVVLAAGAWSGSVEGIAAAARPPVRPVKGQILRLHDPSGPGLIGRVLRYEGGYIVPRGDGRYVIGATVEEQGFNASPTAGGVLELLREAYELVPGIAELELEEMSASFRPGTHDNMPLVGYGGVEGLVWATGHYRNGILLTPLTAELVVEALSGAMTA